MGNRRAWVVMFVAALSLPASASDTDRDGIDSGDNCPTVFNPLQNDCNLDGVGDACNASGATGADTDGDGVCDAIDNCSAVPNVDQGDCNGNGSGDFCEGSDANRDDDGDGLCNGVDVCRQEASGCGMQAITVPFDAALTAPHPTYSGADHTLKGIARYGANQYMWDFGDGTPSTVWTAIANAYNLGVNHVFTGAVGQTFTATLSVRNSANPGVVSTATYAVQIQDSGPLPANLQMEPQRMDVRINMAVDQALWYLHTTMNRGTYADGSPGYAQPYGYWTGQLMDSCHSLDALFTRGHRSNGDYARDPYVETAQRSLTYLLASHASTTAITPQVHSGGTDRPDYNLNTVGLHLGPNDYRQIGPCLAALTHSGTPDRQSLVGSSNLIRGRTYRQLVQDAVEWLAFGQSDSGTYRGGWQYIANSNTAANWDGGMTYVLPALLDAEKAGAVIPSFVRWEMPYFMTYSRHATADVRHGSWGYQGPNDAYVNHRGAAAGLMFHSFVGDSAAHPNVRGVQGFLYRYWAQLNYSGGGAWNGMLGNSIPMYHVATGLRSASPPITRIVEYDYTTGAQTSNGFDWFYQPLGQTQESLSSNLVRRQAANGSWADTFGNDAQSGAYATALDVLVLLNGPRASPPTAAICDCSQIWGLGREVTLQGSCSTHPDTGRSIVSYEWDFHFDGSFDATAFGVNGVLPAGYPSYGLKPVALQVTDDTPAAQGGARRSITTCSITVANLVPVAHPGGPYLEAAGATVTLDGSGSSDADGDPLTYGWDLDDDGIFTDSTSASASFTIPVGTPIGTAFPICLVVSDGTNASAPTCTTVTTANRPPTCNQIQPSTAQCTGGPIVFAVDGRESSDPDGDALSFVWSSDCPGEEFQSPTERVTSLAITKPDRVCLATCKVTLTVSDGSAQSQCSAEVTMEDTVGPSFKSVPVDMQLECGAQQQASLSAWLVSVSAEDACTEVTVSHDYQGLGGGCGGQTGSAVVEWIATDSCAQTASSFATVRVVDSAAPAMTCPAPRTVECAGATTAVAVAATAEDACAGPLLPTTGSTGGYPLGLSQVEFLAMDGCGNTGSCTTSVTVVDTTAPEFDAASLAPRHLTGNCTGAPIVFEAPTALDACGQVTLSCPELPGTQFGANPLLCTATDEAGLVSTAELVVNLTDPGCQVATDGGLPETDAGVTDGGPQGSDAGVTDGGLQETDAGVAPPVGSGPSCGCSSGADGGGLLALLVLGGVMNRRRRRGAVSG